MFSESRLIWHNGALIAWQDAQLHLLSTAVQFGASIFEGIRAYKTPDGPAVFMLDAHLRRLQDSCTIYRMDLPYDLEALKQACFETIAANELQSCYIRPMVLRGYGAMGMNGDGSPIETYIPVWQWDNYLGEEALASGVDVCTASWSRPAPNTFPVLAKAAGHYNNAALIKMEAQANGFAEAIALGRDGMVSEGSGQNLFLVRDGCLFTPPVNGSILSGITRKCVITLARDLGITVYEQALPREAVYIADELFFTGTASEIMPIRSVDHITIGKGARGEVTTQLQQAFGAVVSGQAEDRHGWLSPVRAAVHG